MNKREKKTFVKNLCASVQTELASLIQADRIPEEWDGHELRQLLADHFHRHTFKLEGRRLKEYRNTIAVRNL